MYGGSGKTGYNRMSNFLPVFVSCINPTTCHSVAQMKLKLREAIAKASHISAFMGCFSSFCSLSRVEKLGKVYDKVMQNAESGQKQVRCTGMEGKLIFAGETLEVSKIECRIIVGVA